MSCKSQPIWSQSQKAVKKNSWAKYWASVNTELIKSGSNDNEKYSLLFSGHLFLYFFFDHFTDFISTSHFITSATGIIPRNRRDRKLFLDPENLCRWISLPPVSGSWKTWFHFHWELGNIKSLTVFPVAESIVPIGKSIRHIIVGSIVVISTLFMNRISCKNCLDSSHSCWTWFFFLDLEYTHLFRVLDMWPST